MLVKIENCTKLSAKLVVNPQDSVRNVNGNFIAENSAKVDHWREDLEHLLNFDEQPITSSLSSAADFQPSPAYAVSCDLASEDEVDDDIQKIRNKAYRESGVPAEVYKSCVDTLAHWLYEVIGQAWRDETVPDDWGSGIVVPIYKKTFAVWRPTIFLVFINDCIGDIECNVTLFVDDKIM
ncbi:unnamed protein product [Dibothriocephalus latus]|uniref:Reverse transcriptase domain-containing protein n=1 Tax=Dibothriocephalus latus TaxID=60516 RepID=A0A3P7L5K1_DIBLA|nr:unnamed protein product [Dibothriocephalus latus]